MNKSFAARWHRQRLDNELDAVVMPAGLRALVEAPLVRKHGGLVLEPLAAHATGHEVFIDLTGYEAFINKFHIDDFIDPAPTVSESLDALMRQGARAAVELARRLEGQGPFRVFLSLDPDSATATLRFFERRDGVPWADDDPDAYQLDEVLMIDTD